MSLISCRAYGISYHFDKYFSNNVLTNLYHCMFQCVLMGVQPAAQRQYAQVVTMASTKRTTLAQVNGDMSLIACDYDQ